MKPIRIIVKNGNVTPDGVVASEADKYLARIRAHGVHGVFSVTNNLQVENERASVCAVLAEPGKLGRFR